MQTQMTIHLYPLDSIGVDIAKEKFEAEEGRKLSETAVIRMLIQAGLEARQITRAEMLSKLATPAATSDQS